LASIIKKEIKRKERWTKGNTTDRQRNRQTDRQAGREADDRRQTH